MAALLRIDGMTGAGKAYAGGNKGTCSDVYRRGIQNDTVIIDDRQAVAMKVLSYLPISSYSAMFARVAMGNVDVWEVVVSFIILVASIIGVGMIGSSIYRMGTLRYGNPIKITTAIKSLRKQKNK